MKSLSKVAVVGTFLVLAAGPTLASGDDDYCNVSDRGQWMSIEAISAKARELGYSPREIEIDDGCYEVKSGDNGQRVKVKLHPVTGAVVKVEYDD